MHQRTSHEGNGNNRRGPTGSSAFRDRALGTTLKVLVGTGIVFSLAISVAATDRGHAADKAGAPAAKVSERQSPAQSPQAMRAFTALDNLQRLPEALRASFQTAAALSSKEVCRVAEGLVKKPAVDSIDTIAQYLSNDVHSWTDRMLVRFLRTDPASAKTMSKNELKESFLEQWQDHRGTAQRWLQGCGLVVTTVIGRTRGSRDQLEREASEMFADVLSVIAKGVRRKDPDAIAAAEALARAEQNLAMLMK